jgi:hypothetical protein
MVLMKVCVIDCVVLVGLYLNMAQMLRGIGQVGMARGVMESVLGDLEGVIGGFGGVRDGEVDFEGFVWVDRFLWSFKSLGRSGGKFVGWGVRGGRDGNFGEWLRVTRIEGYRYLSELLKESKNFQGSFVCNDIYVSLRDKFLHDKENAKKTSKNRSRRAKGQSGPISGGNSTQNLVKNGVRASQKIPEDQKPNFQAIKKGVFRHEVPYFFLKFYRKVTQILATKNL